MTTRWKLRIEYDGSGFCGWQRQADAPSVQQAIEEAIFKFSGESPTLHAAGRTDTGVHARAQTAHFDLEKDTTPDTVRDAINFHVRPNKAVILDAEIAHKDFHARFDAIKRSYRYFIINRRAPLAIKDNYSWHVARPLDIDAMQKAADLLIGKHDFSTFRARDCQSNSPIKTLDLLKITQKDEAIVIETEARSFLYHQVRNMVGSLSLVGNGNWSIDDFQTALKACDRTKGGPTAPAHGLFFWEVTYPQK